MIVGPNRWEGVSAGADTLPDGGLHVRCTFTGSGSEYFRIWVVNLLLTVLTLGIYSAWAKVRKARYFWQNTRLEGHVFDYHGRPIAILRGRIIALVLLTGYSWAFQFSPTAGVVTVAVLCGVGPWLFMRAQQFKLGNTSFRGLRFGFRARPSEAYRVVLPVLILWFGPAALFTFITGPQWLTGIASFLTLGAIPWMHHRVKAYQHGRATYGDQDFTFLPISGRFYGIYAKALGFLVLGSLFGAIIAAVTSRLRPPEYEIGSWTLETVVLVALFGLVTYLVTWPYLAARLQQAVWTSTRLGTIRFRADIRARTLLALACKNVLFTLVTCGLYWPFAAIALAHYRIECMQIHAEVPLDAIAVDLRARPVTAAGDSALDAFGIDLGL